MKEEIKVVKIDGGLDAGYIYAPYVPLELEPMEFDGWKERPFMKVKEWLKNKNKNKEIESRYADKPIRTGFYGVVNVENLKTE